MKLPLPGPDYEWQQLSLAALLAWLAFYVFILFRLWRSDDGIMIDNVNLIVHESGHLLFGYLGRTIGIWGGTIMQLLVPAALTVSFAWRGQIYGAGFCGFFFFENFLGIARYMADARTMLLPLVTVGEPATNPHDWWNIFHQLGLLNYDTRIAAVVRSLGWAGMLAVMGWMVWMYREQQNQGRPAAMAAQA